MQCATKMHTMTMLTAFSVSYLRPAWLPVAEAAAQALAGRTPQGCMPGTSWDHVQWNKLCSLGGPSSCVL